MTEWRYPRPEGVSGLLLADRPIEEIGPSQQSDQCCCVVTVCGAEKRVGGQR